MLLKALKQNACLVDRNKVWI